MIVIKFSPKFEDRFCYFQRANKLEGHAFSGVKIEMVSEPTGKEHEHYCYYKISYHHAKQVNPILSWILEFKDIMGVDDLELCFCYNDKEYYSQIDIQNNWFKWLKI
jgi:hypothetical protein